jgi:hypothetical protein
MCIRSLRIKGSDSRMSDLKSNKALQPTPLGVGAAYGGHAPRGAAELDRSSARAAFIEFAL